jgi:hypothetical protein
LSVVLIFGIIAIWTRFSPFYDKNIGKPDLNSMPAFTNAEEFEIRGRSPNADKVVILVNGQIVSGIVYPDKNNMNAFSYKYRFPKEGEYTIQAASVKGWLILSMSDKTDFALVTFDKTPPSNIIELNYSEETVEDNFDLSGKAEPNLKIILHRGDSQYSEKVDGKGYFKFNDVPLQKGGNHFTVELIDQAGNGVILGRTIDIAMGSILENGISTSVGSGTGANSQVALPESAGEIEKAMGELFKNDFMVVVGLIALVLLAFNSFVVLVKLRRK